jgi:anaerobic selenocysteine-containing dehydrogenase/ferredoxin-NADP reductase
MERAMIEEKVGFCALCKSRCGATYRIEDGRLLSAGPAPSHPTGKSLCVKGKAAPEILYSADRLMYPLRRTKPKSSPDPGWQRITWEEALSEASTKLAGIRDRFGAEAIAFSTTTPSGTALSDGADWVERLIQLFGTPNWVSTTEICNWHKDFAHAFTFGTGIPYPDYGNADAIVLWGFNPSAVWLDQATQVAEARARGAAIIVVDPRQAGYAIGADHWLRVRPGSDGILALGIMRLLIEERGYDEHFLRRWTNGAFLVRDDNGDFLRERDVTGREGQSFVVIDADGAPNFVERNSVAAAVVLERAKLRGPVVVQCASGNVSCRTALDHLIDACTKYSLDEVSEMTWVDKAKIHAAARALLAANRVSYYTWTGLGQHAESTQIDRALATLMALKGCFDSRGGNVILASHPKNPVCGPSMLSRRQTEKALGFADKPLGPPNQGRVTAHDFYKAVIEGDPYRVRALVGFGANLAVAHAQSKRGLEALQQLDFYLHCDVFENPSARYADILLPVNTPWEREALRVGFGSGQKAEEWIQFRQKMVEPIGESRSDTEICFDLACRLGLSKEFFGGDIEAGLAYYLEPTGVTLSELRANPEGVRRPLKTEYRKYAVADGKKVSGFATETGQVELYSELLKRNGQPAVPVFDVDRFPGNEAFPFVLTTSKMAFFCHSQHRQIPSLRKRESHPSVELAPETAEAQGLEAGDWVELETLHGRARMRVKLNKTLHAKVVRASYGWWQANTKLGLPGYDPFTDAGSNYNLLVGTDRLDPVSGAAAHRSTSCRLNVLASEGFASSWRGFKAMRVTSRRELATDVVAIGLTSLDGGPLPDFEPGQHLVLRWREGDAEPIIRCYSLTGPARNLSRTSYEIAVRRVGATRERADLPAGRMSTLIHERLSIGETVDIKAPSGKFCIPSAADEPIVLVAGGIGITPFMAYLETVAMLQPAPRIHLVYANRTAASEAFSQRLVDLQRLIPSLTVAKFFSDVHAIAPRGAQRRISATTDILLEEFTDPPRVFLCGPPSMIAALRRALADAGHPREFLFEEAFTASQVDVSQLPNGPFSVTFSNSGKTVTWDRTRGSLLELAEAEGVKITNGCRAGQCESCALEVLDGKFLYRTALDRDDADPCLACQAVPASDLVIAA